MFQPNKEPQPISPMKSLPIIIVSAYIGAQIISDISSLKIGVVWGLAVDMGTFIYPITFTLRDLVHKALGKKNAQLLIIIAGVINLLMALYFRWIISVPSDPSWGLGTEFASILSPMWRIVIASIAAEVISELVDTEIYHLFVTYVSTRFQWARVLLSNSVSIPVDNLIFVLGAFGGILPLSTLKQIFLINFLMKFGISILSMPFIYIPAENMGSDSKH